MAFLSMTKSKQSYREAMTEDNSTIVSSSNLLKSVLSYYKDPGLKLRLVVGTFISQKGDSPVFYRQGLLYSTG